MCAKRRGSSTTPKILVIEAMPSLAKVLRISLRAAGFDVAEAAAGGQALEILDQGPTDAVVVDPGLPDGLGRAVLDRLRQAGDHGFAAWVVVSELDPEEVTRRYGPLGDHYLAMPFDPWYLAAMLKRLLSEKNGGRE
jgi:two-component system KDP operon response regulator KdpE